MLKVQEFLRNGGTIKELEETKGIVSTYSETDPLVILNYSQIDSPKKDPICMECRGLTLELNTWNLVARSFLRFFNLNEV